MSKDEFVGEPIRKKRPRLILPLLFFCVAGALVLASADYLLPGEGGWKERLLSLWLENLPDHDYTEDGEKLLASDRPAEAREIVNCVLAHQDMPGQARARELRKDIDEALDAKGTQKNGILSKGVGLLKGFVMGSDGSSEGDLGSLVADISQWGNVRDLVRKGIFKNMANASGPGEDAEIAALEKTLKGTGGDTALGAPSEWFPGMMALFKKTDSLTPSFAKSLGIGKMREDTAMNPAVQTSIEDTATTAKNLGLVRTMVVFRNVRDESDVAAIAKFSGAAPDATFLAARSGYIKLLKDLQPGEESVALVNRAARKGDAGLSGVESWSTVLRYDGTPSAKLPAREATVLLRPAMAQMEKAAGYPAVWALLLGSGICAIWCALLLVTYPIRFIFR